MSNDHSSSGGARNIARADPDASGESALGRWSRRKLAARAKVPEEVAPGSLPQTRIGEQAALPAVVPPDAPPSMPSEPREEGAVAEQSALPEPELPSLEELDMTVDFTRFLRQGVDPLLRRAALRKLWTIDPVFSHLDGLVDYAEDFTGAAQTTSLVQTAVRVTHDAVAMAEQIDAVVPSEELPSHEPTPAPETSPETQDPEPRPQSNSASEAEAPDAEEPAEAPLQRTSKAAD